MTRKAQICAFLKEVVLATTNTGKIKEFLDFADFSDIKINDDIEETGSTFLDNARIKSRHIFKTLNKPSLGDDSGLVIPCIGHRPGVYSARYATREDGIRDFPYAFKKLEDEIKKVTHDTRVNAYFECALVLTLSDSKEYMATGKCHGKLIFPPRGDNAFGYDPIFIKDGFDKTFAEMDFSFKNKISHRYEAFKSLLNKIEKDI